MLIKEKKSRYGENIFVFYFVNEEEKNNVLNDLEKCAIEAESRFDMTNLKRIVTILKNRVDNKYKTEGYEFSGMLFTGEFVELTYTIMFLTMFYKNALDSLLEIIHHS